MKKIAIYGTIIVVLAGIAWYAYHRLGGEEVLAFEAVPAQRYAMAGVLFEGKYNDRKLEAVFYKVKAARESDALPGTLAVLDSALAEEKSKKGIVHQFIGVLLAAGAPRPALPEGFVWREVSMPGAVRTTIKSHNLVMPNPRSVRQQAAAHAAKMGKSLGRVTMEQYHSDRALVVAFALE